MRSPSHHLMKPRMITRGSRRRAWSVTARGQRQRLALARALIRNPDLLVLNEATSALDTESEFMIQQTLEGQARGMSIVVVGHRLSTVQKADHLYIGSKGVLSSRAHGTPLRWLRDALMKELA